MDGSFFVHESQHVARLRASGQQRFDGIVDTAITEVAQKGITGPKRKEGQRGSITIFCFGEESVDYLVGSSVAADSDETTIAAAVGIASDGSCVAQGLRLGNFDLDVGNSKAL